jgi:hypothetical protein
VSRHQRDQDFIRFCSLDESRPTRVRRRRASLDTNGQAIAYLVAIVILVSPFLIAIAVSHH